MTVEYSEDFKRQLDQEIIRVKILIEALESQVKTLQALLANEAPGEAPGANKRLYNKRSPVLPPSVIAVAHERRTTRGLSLKDMLAIDTSTMRPDQLKKHQKAIYMKQYREKNGEGSNNGDRWSKAKKAAGLEGAGKMVGGMNGPKKDMGTKFTLDREFDLEEKDVRLMLSYLISWKGMGRLMSPEITAFENVEGIPVGRYSLPDKELVRQIFYSARGRVIEKAKATSGI